MNSSGSRYRSNEADVYFKQELQDAANQQCNGGCATVDSDGGPSTKDLLREVLQNQKRAEDQLKALFGTVFTLIEEVRESKKQIEQLRNDLQRHGSGPSTSGDDPVKAVALKQAEDLLGPFVPGGKASLLVHVQLAKDPYDALNNVIKAVFTTHELQTCSVTGKNTHRGRLDPRKLEAVTQYACLRLGINAADVKKQLLTKMRYLRTQVEGGENLDNDNGIYPATLCWPALGELSPEAPATSSQSGQGSATKTKRQKTE